MLLQSGCRNLVVGQFAPAVDDQLHAGKSAACSRSLGIDGQLQLLCGVSRTVLRQPPPTLALFKTEHTLDARVMAHPSYSKMRSMRKTADQHRNTASQGASERVRHFGFE